MQTNDYPVMSPLEHHLVGSIGVLNELQMSHHMNTGGSYVMSIGLRFVTVSHNSAQFAMD